MSTGGGSAFGGKIFIGADHRGFKFKKKIVKLLTQKKYDVVDMGAFTDKISCDYPHITKKVAHKVLTNKEAKGILVCMTGLGHSITANKIPGIRAALCYNKKAAMFSRKHNDANVLILGAKFVKKDELFEIVKTWLREKFEGGRHLRRVNQIKKIEKEMLR